MTFSRRALFSRLALYGIPTATAGYSSTWEKNQLSVSEVTIPLEEKNRSLDGLKIALMADFHHDDFGSNALIAQAVRTINDADVDVVVLAGDYISRDLAPMTALCRELAAAKSRLGSFAVLGNHDCWHYHGDMPRMLADAGIQLLVDEHIAFDTFALAGIQSVWGGRPNFQETISAVPRSLPILVAWHEPDTFDDYQSDRVILQVSGHTHGGQICAPFYGPIRLPAYGKRYPYGHYQKDNRSLFVTRGIGTLTIPARFLCPPELALLTLHVPALTA